MTFGNRKFAGFLGAATVVIIAEYVLVLSDCVISGQVLGETALGAMNLLMPVFSSVSFFTWMLAVGTSIVYSEAMGRTQNVLASKLAGQGVLAAVGLGVLLVGATMLLEAPYLSFMAPDEATLAFSGQYWDWYPLVVMLECVDLVLLYLVYTDGGETACLVSYVGQVLVNIVSSYCLCAYTDLGMSGISLGTVFAYFVGIAALVPRLLSKSCGLKFRFAFMPRRLLGSLRASFGDASAGLFHALLFFVITKYVLYFWGPDALPVTAVVFCIVRLTVFFNGVGIALQPLETVYHGEGNETAISRLVRFAALVSVSEGLLISAVVFFAPELIIWLVGINDPALVGASRRAARLTVVGLSGYAVTYMLNSHYQYVGRPGRSVRLTALAFFVMPALLVLVLGKFVGMDGVWIAVAAGPVCALIPFVPLWLRRSATGSRPVMWEVNFAHPGGMIQVVRELADELEDTCSSVRVGELTRALTDALWQLHAANGAGVGKLRAEVTLKRLPDGLQLILRDDGRHVAVSCPGAETVHLPVTGFNRNILTWRDFDIMSSKT